MSIKGMIRALSLLIALPALAQASDKIIYQENDLWVLSSPWSTNQRWCEDHIHPGRAIPVNLFYKSPHSERLNSLSLPFDQWTYEKLLPAITAVCGVNAKIDYITLAMYQKPDNIPVSGLLSALEKNKVHPWDSITVKVSATGATVSGHRALEAQYHLSPQQLAALDPRAAGQAKKQTKPNEINDYLLHQDEGVKFISWFDQPGPQWCHHVYVSVIAEYQNEAVRKALLANHPGVYLQENIIPQIQKICPKFPNAAKYYKQSLVLKFRPTVGRIADEKLNTHKLNFKITDQGQLYLIKDIAYQQWKDRDPETFPFETETEPTVAKAQSQDSGNASKLASTQQKQSQQIETIAGKLEKQISQVIKELAIAQEMRELLKDPFSPSEQAQQIKAFGFNEIAVKHFNAALTHYNDAKKALNQARLFNEQGSLTHIQQASGKVSELIQHYTQAKDPFLKGSESSAKRDQIVDALIANVNKTNTN